MLKEIIENKSVRTLIALSKRKNVSDIAKETDTSYSHALKVVKELEERGMVYSQRSGRNLYFYLTDPGKIVASFLGKIKKELS